MQLFYPPPVFSNMTFDSIFEHIQKTALYYTQGDKVQKCGMVSGSINADGPAHKQRNIKRLITYTQAIQEKVTFPVFCASYFFVDEIYSHFEKQGAVYEDYMFFWRKVLKSGLVTDIFMMDGWKRSIGAKDEYDTAKKCNIVIHIESA